MTGNNKQYYTKVSSEYPRQIKKTPTGKTKFNPNYQPNHRNHFAEPNYFRTFADENI